MPDLHVVSLRYALRPSEHASFTNPPPIEFETQDAQFRLAEGELTCKMKTHFADPADARPTVEPTIRAWEIDADLRLCPDVLKFDFDGADVIDSTPAPPGVYGVAYIVGSGAATASGSASVLIGYLDYPAPPPSTFRMNPDADAILGRYQMHRAGREPLQSMAYFCLTFLETKAGSRHDAAALYRIDHLVLKKIGELTSTRGDTSTARKANAAHPLSRQEHAWLDAAVKMLIWRTGDTRDAAALPLMTMSDLPTL